jgi:hypothetical protein
VPVVSPAAKAEQVIPGRLEVKDGVAADVPSQLDEQVVQAGDDQRADVRGQERPDDLLQPAEPDRPAVDQNAPRWRQFPRDSGHRSPSMQASVVAHDSMILSASGIRK